MALRTRLLALAVLLWPALAHAQTTVAGAMATSPYAVLGTGTFPVLTDAATVAVNASKGPLQSLTFTSAVGAGRTLGFPTGMTSGVWLTLQAIQPATGSYCFQFANGAGFYTPFGIQPQCNTASDGGTDYFPGLGVSPSRVDVPLVPAQAFGIMSGTMANLIPSRLPTLVGHVCGSAAGAGGTCGAMSAPTTTETYPITISSTNDFVTVLAGVYLASGSDNGPSTVTIGGAGCSAITNTLNNGSGGSGSEFSMWRCPTLPGTGSQSVVATWPSTIPGSFQTLFIQEWAPLPNVPAGADPGLGAAGTGSAASATISSTGAAANGDLVIGILNSGSAGMTVSSGTQLDMDGTGHTVAAYRIAPTATSASLGFSWTTSGGYSYSIGVLQ